MVNIFCKQQLTSTSTTSGSGALCRSCSVVVKRNAGGPISPPSYTTMSIKTLYPILLFLLVLLSGPTAHSLQRNLVFVLRNSKFSVVQSAKTSIKQTMLVPRSTSSDSLRTSHVVMMAAIRNVADGAEELKSRKEAKRGSNLKEEPKKANTAMRGAKAGGFGILAKNREDSEGSNAKKKTSDTRSPTIESQIQHIIDTYPGLREAMSLQEDLREFEQVEKLSAMQRTTLPPQLVQEMKVAKPARLAELNSEGWTKSNVQRKLLEITWDSSAEFRDARHQDIAVPLDAESHMLSVAKWTISSTSSSSTPGIDTEALVCDVGCGNGILLKFIDQISGGKYCHENFHGVDLSSKMLDFARKTYPRADFHHGDFLNFRLPDEKKFSAVTFNECLHNFLDIPVVLRHASELLSANGRIVISHPRGFDNVFLQYSKNRLLVPNLLPTEDELAQRAAELGFKVIVAPKIKSSKYLAILEKNA